MDIRDLLSSSAEKLAENETNFSKKEIKEMLEAKQALQNSAAILSKTEKKFTVKKGGYTEQELKDMLIIQSRTEEDVEHELNGKLIDICEKMKEQFKISRIPTSMVVGVANEIFVQIERGNIVNVAELEKNPTVIKVAQKFCEKQQLVENFSATMQGKEPIHQIDNQVEGTNYIASSVEVARAFERVNKRTETEEKLTQLFDNFTPETFEDDREKARRLWESEEREKEYEHRMSDLSEIYRRGDENERSVAVSLAIANEIVKSRIGLSPEEQKKSKLQTNAVFFSYLRNSNIAAYDYENIVEDLKMYLILDTAFSQEENEELRTRIAKVSSREELQEILLDVMERTSLENGVEFDRNSIDHHAKQINSKHIIGIRSSEISLNSLAAMVLPKELKSQYTQMLKKVTDLKKNVELNVGESQYQKIDLAVLEEIKSYDINFYLETLRLFGKSAQRANNKVEQERFEKLADEATENLRWKNVLNEKVNNRLSKKESEQKECKKEVAGVFISFMKTTTKRTESVGKLKNEFLYYVERESAFSVEEKAEILERIKEITSKEEFSAFLLDKSEEYCLRYGLNFDREKILKMEQRKEIPKGELLGKYLADARAQVRLGELHYEKYLKLTRCLRNKEYNGQYDLSVIDEIKEIDEVLYRELLVNVEVIGKKKNDSTLMEFCKSHTEPKKDCSVSKVISVENIDTKTVVETIGDGSDALMKSSQKLEERANSDEERI